MKSRNPIIHFDKLQMYFREPYEIDLDDALGKVIIYQPSIGDIVHFGEDKFFNSLNIFVSNTTSYRLALWGVGIDWNEFSDYNLFLMLYSKIDDEIWDLFFRDLHKEDFTIVKRNEEELTLFNSKEQVEINEEVYFHISQYIRTMFNINPEEKLTTENMMKKWFIDKDKRQLEIDKTKAEKGEVKSTSIKSLISSCVNHSGFKYKLQELREVGVCEFYDSVQRLQVYENATAVMKGMYSGFVDTKAITPDSYNFMKDI